MSLKRFEIAIPKPYREDEHYENGNKRYINIDADYASDCERIYLPRDVFTHKEYPRCKCGNKYVKIRGYNRCLFCVRKITHRKRT